MLPILFPQPTLQYPAVSGNILSLNASTLLPGNVPLWQDTSGNGNNPTQSSSPQDPICQAKLINGLNTLQFVGSFTSTLTLPSALYAIANGANTSIAVARRNSDSGTQFIYGMGGSGTTLHGLFFGTAGQIKQKNGTSASNGAATTGITTTNYNIIVGTFDGAATSTIQINNGTIFTGSDSSVQPTISNANIGSRSSITFYLDGNIPALNLYNRKLSAAEIFKIVKFYSILYNIPIS